MPKTQPKGETAGTRAAQEQHAEAVAAEATAMEQAFTALYKLSNDGKLRVMRWLGDAIYGPRAGDYEEPPF